MTVRNEFHILKSKLVFILFVESRVNPNLNFSSGTNELHICVLNDIILPIHDLFYFSTTRWDPKCVFVEIATFVGISSRLSPTMDERNKLDIYHREDCFQTKRVENNTGFAYAKFVICYSFCTWRHQYLWCMRD